MRSKFHRFALRIGRGTTRIGRWTWYASAAILAVLALIFALVRIGLPALAEKKVEIENFISDKSSYPVRIGKLDAYWEGLRPGLRIQGLEIFSSVDLTRAVRFGEVRMSLALLPLLWGELQINTLMVAKPSLSLERLADGRLRITGFDPIQVAGQAANGKFLQWLLRQKELVIEDGELQWFDHMGKRQGIYLHKINLNLQNFADRHKLGISAQFPPDMCGDCSLIVDITGNPLMEKAWSGHIFLKAVDMTLEGFPVVVRDVLPKPLAGKFNVQLWTTWQRGKLRSADGELSVADLRLPLKKLQTTIAVRAARMDVALDKRGKHWDLNLENLRLGLRGPTWLAGDLRIAHGPGGSTVHMEHVNLDDVTGFLMGIDASGEFMRALKTVRPGGKVQDLKVRIDADGAAPGDYSIEAKLENINTQPFRKVPGVRGVSGYLSTQGRRGTFLLDAADVTVSAPHFFRVPVEFRAVSGRLNWVMREAHWQVIGEDLRVSADDGKATGRVEVRGPYNTKIKPYLSLQANFSDGNGAHAGRYYPINLWTEKTIAWLDQSIVSGHVTSGDVVYEGDMARFPFRDGHGRFEGHLRVRDGVFNYLPGWTPVTSAEADVHFKGSEMLVTSNHGKIGDLNVTNIVVRAKDLRKTGNPLVEVAGTLEGPVTEALHILRQIPPKKPREEWRSYLEPGLAATGDGVIKLKLSIPVRKAKTYTMQGEYFVSNGALKLQLAQLTIEQIRGHVGFNQSGLTTGTLRGRLLSGDLTVDINRQTRGLRHDLLFSAHGTVAGAELAKAFQWRFAHHIKGSARWRGTMRLHRGVGRVQIDADLNRVRTTLPTPLNRPNGISEKLVLKSKYESRGTHDVTIRIGEDINGRFLFTKQKGNWGLIRGRIGFGERPVRLPKARGLHLVARAAHVDAGAWLRALGYTNRDVSRPPDYLRRFTGEFKSLYLLDRKFGALNIDLIRGAENWVGEMRGDGLDGRVRISRTAKGSIDKVEFDLERLVVLETEPGAGRADVDPRTLPTITIKSKSFVYKGKQLGELDFLAVHTGLGWKIVQLNLVRPEMRLFLNGDWTRLGNEQLTELALQFSSSDLGKTLQAFDAPDQMEGGKVDLTAKLSWKGMPANPDLSTLEGNVEVSAEDGRFLRIKHRGQLFGLLDFSSVAKFLTLDFRPLFGKGFPFKTLGGDISIESGDAYTRNLYMTGSAAQMSFNGRVGLVTEDFDFALQVVPRLGTNIGVWGLFGPQAGVVLLALEKLLKKEIARGTRTTYMVKGPWDAPTIERLGKTPEPDEAETGRR